MTTRWLDRRIAHPGPHLALCLSESDFRAAVARLKAPQIPNWVVGGKGATTHTFTKEGGGVVCIVCMADFSGRSPIEVAGLLVHEAVHVWQIYAEDIGEQYEGREQEAYAIQCISQELMAEFARRQSHHA